MATPQPPQSSVPPVSATAPEPRHLASGYGASWWGEGWRIFAAAPGTWIGITLILLVLMFLMVIVPIIGHIAQTLLLPVFAGGVILGCHALARGEPLRVGHLFDGFGSGRFGALIVLGLVMLAAGIVLSVICAMIVVLAVGFGGFAALASLDPTNLDLRVLTSLGVGFLIVFLVALIGVALIAMAYWFAPALVVLNNEEPLRALSKSFVASWRNLGAMAIYGIIYIGLAIVATIPLGLGWLVLAPMLIGSCYAGWRTIFA
ncbi:MAG TPA: BPSS1780 family membrane protein [Casimicrobiaceae bacterium]|jgi:uncharacterized membrane protein|nr:BPSS1780 family membrane protein [Casimicrobiaceae bacterium]